MSIKPTVGRKVWFYNSGLSHFSDMAWDGSSIHGYRDQSIQPLDATIVGVISVDIINIAGYDNLGYPYSRTYVKLWDGEGSPPLEQHCRWMPHQLGQAKP